MKKFRLKRELPGMLAGEFVWLNFIGDQATEVYCGETVANEFLVLTYRRSIPEFDLWFGPVEDVSEAGGDRLERH